MTSGSATLSKFSDMFTEIFIDFFIKELNYLIEIDN